VDERRWHNIKPNEQTRIPQRHIFVDTEAHREWRNGVDTQEWRCGVAIFARRGRDGKYATNSSDYLSVEDLWRDVSDFTSSDGRTVLWTHNLGYDIRIANVFQILPSLGWTLTGHNIASRGTWIEWRRNGATLILCDSFSIFPTSMERVGTWFRMGKPDLPVESDEMGVWLDRCRADCGILATAVIRYLEWLREGDMGNWQLTGNAQAWAAYRHKFMTHKLTVHSEREVLEKERRALWAGRCEAYWHGEYKGGYVYEYDFKNAYPRIAKEYPVPVKYVGVIENGPQIWHAMEAPDTAMLVECEVETSVPVLPTEDDGRILWPVGRFRTVVWDVEVRAAVAAGATVTPVRGWAYRVAPALKAWGEWILEQIGEENGSCDEWLKAILKHWSRSLIGRMAMSYQKWEYDGDMPFESVHAGVMKDAESGEVTDYIQIGRGVWVNAGKEEWQHSMPMITGYIQSVARVQLWDVMQLMPKGSVLYADTDSIFVTEIDREEAERVIRSIPGCSMRLKRVWNGIAIYGPRQIITGTEVRIAGIPKRAERIGRSEFKGEVWESVATALAFGRPSSVYVRDRTWAIAGIDRRRRKSENGFTEPFVLGRGEEE
jgi:DNA polymerase type B, organellar and viral